MKKLEFKKIPVKQILKYSVSVLCMALLNFTLPQREPLSYPLFYALLMCGLDPFLLSGGYLVASLATLSLYSVLSCAVQAAFLLLVFAICRRLGRRVGWEKLAWIAIGLIPFLFIAPHAGYPVLPIPVIWQKVILSSGIALLCLLFEGGVRALLTRALRCRLSAYELSEILLLWLGLGMGIISLAGETAFLFFAMTLLLFGVLLLKNASGVTLALALSLPLCVMRLDAVPAAAFALLSCVPLLLVPYGRIVSSLSFFISFLGVQYFEGLYARDAVTVVFTLLCCAVPAAAACCIPEKYFSRAGRTLLFYRERTLPRIAINRNRRAVGEQLYEVSSLFRAIETAFEAQEQSDGSGAALRNKVVSSLCASCPENRKCKRANYLESLDKLIAVGMAKGKVSLIDMPQELTADCKNAAGLLFTLNRYLSDYTRYAKEMEAAREGRRLLAGQARGVSEILRDIALEQSEEFTFSEEEHALSLALSGAGMMSSEIFIYGEGKRYTVSLTLEENTDGKKLAKVASAALHVPLALAEKIPLTADRACFILRKKPNFDASFGLAALPKEGEQASGDTHSILKIDERRFLVALSDGMGSGEEARTVSDRTLSLLESFYKAKMPSETVLGTVNRLIAFSSEETFSCLDLASVDLDTGDADIVKIGSPAGFILSGDELRVLEGDSLPLGLIEAIRPSTMRVQMKEDDFLIFMSDGVTTAFGSNAELCSYLSALEPLNPQSLAEQILENALRRYQGAAEDDMTVLTVKLMKPCA